MLHTSCLLLKYLSCCLLVTTRPIFRFLLPCEKSEGKEESRAMDAGKKIDVLDQKREELEQQLKQKGISEAKEIVIRQQIIAIGNEITALYQMMPQGDTHWTGHPLLHFIGATGFTSLGAAWWILLPRYTAWRHWKVPYSTAQLEFRKRWLNIDLDNPKDPRWAKRVYVGSIVAGLIERCRNGPKSPPPMP
jgi:hypothetical protein